jgi:acetyl-CoA acyltransferase 2
MSSLPLSTGPERDPVYGVWNAIEERMTQRRPMEIVFLSGRRTPFGTFGGSLRGFTAVDLGVHAARAALESAGIDATAVQHVFFGNAVQTTTDTIYAARHVGLRAGVPVDVPMLTVNRLCGSGFQAIVSGAQEILLGEIDVALCGGAESMSQAPHIVRGARWGDLRLGEPGNAFEDSLWAALFDSHCGLSMAQTAEKLAEQKGVTRADADLVACRSQTRAVAGWAAGHFAAEVAPIPVKTRKGEVLFERDEHMRPDTTLEGLAALRPYFRKDGLVTAGNASGIGDGAAAVVIASAAWADANGMKPIGRLVSWGVAGVPPEIMGIGPVPASRQALKSADLSLEDMDLVEVNEAFAPQYAAVEKELGLDPEKTNVNGGAIALTHPLAASGARITVHLLHELRRRGGRFGLGSACIGGGQGMAVVVEALP